MEQILSIVVRNQPGVLMRVAGMFSRRGFNIAVWQSALRRILNFRG